jgi:hypothetical protein
MLLDVRYDDFNLANLGGNGPVRNPSPRSVPSSHACVASILTTVKLHDLDARIINEVVLHGG